MPSKYMYVHTSDILNFYLHLDLDRTKYEPPAKNECLSAIPAGFLHRED